MKKLILLLVFFLTSCAPVRTLPPTATPTTPDLVAFTTGAECPGLCWLGIRVGTTTRQEAIDIFTKAPGNVNMRLTPASLEGEWITDQEKLSKAFVAIHFTDDVVDSLQLGRMGPFKTSDFVALLGEPDKMWIFWTDDNVGHGFKRTRYALYYADQKIEVQAGYSGLADTDWGGPKAEAQIEWIRIGLPPQYEEKYLQPWLGYGHLEDYRLKAVPTPGR